MEREHMFVDCFGWTVCKRLSELPVIIGFHDLLHVGYTLLSGKANIVYRLKKSPLCV